MPSRFKNRTEAGRSLAAQLRHLAGQDVIVLALPRGGLPVAFEIAQSLRAPLDVLNVRKLGVPWQEELAMGAVATGGVRVLNDEIVHASGLSLADIDAATARQRAEIDRRERLYRGGRPAPNLAGRTVIVVDDGIATGATVRAALAVVRAQHPARLVLATPVVQASVASDLAKDVDELVASLTPDSLYAIGLWYDDFPQLTDDDVQEILRSATWSVSSSISSTVSSASQTVSPSPVTDSTR